MATTLSGTVKLIIDLVEATTADIGTIQYDCYHKSTRTYADGVGADQANALFSDTRSLADNAYDDLDLTSLTDARGVALAFARVKALWVRNNGTASTLQLGGDANSVPLFGAAADYLILPPGGEVLMICTTADGWVVTGATGDIIQLHHGHEDAAALTYDIVILGGKT
ncbi:MAG: hypothetical protein ABIF82_12520 [Planctomycetota bacterium]